MSTSNMHRRGSLPGYEVDASLAPSETAAVAHDVVIEVREIASLESFHRTISVATSKRTAGGRATMFAVVSIRLPGGSPASVRLGEGGLSRLSAALLDAKLRLEAHAGARPGRPAR